MVVANYLRRLVVLLEFLRQPLRHLVWRLVVDALEVRGRQLAGRLGAAAHALHVLLELVNTVLLFHGVAVAYVRSVAGRALRYRQLEPQLGALAILGCHSSHTHAPTRVRTNTP